LGRREQGGYKKSLLFEYFANGTPRIRWEKRFLKRYIHNNLINRTRYNLKVDANNSPNAPIDVNGEQDWDDKNDYEYNFVRALLGLPEQYEFDATPSKLIVKIGSERIKRFKSPLFYKVYDNELFLCANEIDENHEVFGHLFSMHIKSKEDRDYQEILNPPSVPNSFSIRDFLAEKLDSSYKNQK
jgi:hypothetical protein